MLKSSALAIPSDETRLGEVREFVSRFCEHARLPERSAANLRLAVDQVCSFVIHHAYKKKSGEIRIELETGKGWIEVAIRDDGKPLKGVRKQRDLVAWLAEQARLDASSVQLQQLVDKISYTPRQGNNVWCLRKKFPARPRFQGGLRARYAVRAALVLGALVTIACVPLWILEGKRHRDTEEQALQTLAFGLSEAARPALEHKKIRSDEQERLQETVMATRRREPRLLSVHIIDPSGLIRASDRSSALFTRFTDNGEFGEPDAEGTQQRLRSIEGNPVMLLSVPVMKSHSKTGLVGQIYLTMRWDEVEARVQEARIRLLFGALLLYAVSTLVVIALIGGILQSVQKVLDAMRSFQSEDASFDLEGEGEAHSLASAFRQVTSRMQAAESSAAKADGLRKDMVLAREIQETILPQAAPEVPGYELAKYYKPAEDVGGDYYDFLTVNEDMVGIVVADVSGKGVSGSLVMSMLRTALRMEARDNTNAGDVLARMNAFLSADMRKGMFVTMFYVILDSKNRVVSYASAGHTPMILYRAETAETFFLKPRGFPVCLQLPDHQTFGRSLDVERLQLHEGDLLLLYTDGITEALDAKRQQYGEERLLEVIRRTAGGSAQGCVDAIRDDLERFRGMAAQSDDVTLVAVRETSVVRSSRGTVRQKLEDLVENQGMSVEDACEKLQVSPSTYYRFQHAKRAALRANVEATDGAETKPEEPAASETVSEGTSGQTPATSATPTSPTTDEDQPVEAVDSKPETREQVAAPSDSSGCTIESKELRGRAEAIQNNASAAYVWLEGFIDSSSCAEMEAYLRGLHEEWSQVILDLTGILYLSSRAWGILATAAADLENRQGQLLLTGLNAEVADVHKMLGFEDVLPTYASALEAKKALFAPNSSRPVAAPDTAPQAEDETDEEDAASPRNRKPRRRSDGKKRRKEHKKRPDLTEELPGSPARIAQTTPQSLDMEMATEETAGEWESLRVISGCVGPQGEVRLLGIEGILDTVSTRRFAEVLESRIEKGDIRILVDLSRTEFISSAGWGVFASALRELRAQQGDLKLFGMGRELTSIFKMLGLDAVLESFDVMSAALEAFGLVAPPEPAAEAPSRVVSVADGSMAEDPFAKEIAEEAAAVAHIGKLQVQVHPFGKSGNAMRLIMEGELTGEENKELLDWLNASEPLQGGSNRLLLLDARGVQSGNEQNWLSLLGADANQAEHWGSVHMLRPQTHCALPRDLGFPVHETLEDALQAFQNRSTASVQRARLDDPGLFSADSSIRREGWQGYIELLKQTHEGEEKK